MLADGSTDAAGSTLRSGEHVGRYVVLYRLGGGGMGVVYVAYDPQLDRKLAIKLLKPRFATVGEDERAGRNRMLREAQVLARLSHPNVVAIHDVGLWGDRLFVAMDFVEGQTLRRWAAAQERSIAEILAAYVQAGEGLSAAHRANIVHRDFKPDNAIIDRDGRVQVLDFGLARLRGNTDSHATAAPRNQTGAGKPLETVLEGGVLGTPAYMAAEQHGGGRTGPATDQFALCVSLWEALHRRLPFAGDDTATLADNIVNGRLQEPPRGRKIPTRLRRILLRGLSLAPNDRWPTVAALSAELRAVPRRRRRTIVATVGGSIAIAGAAAAWIAAAAPEIEGPCGESDRLAGAWDEPRRDAGAAAFASAGAARSWSVVAGALDRWTARWTEQYGAACDATHVRAEQPIELLELRLACLAGQRDQLAALAGILAEPDAAVIDHAIEAAEALPDPIACSDVVALRLRPAAPDDPALRAEVDALETELARITALDNAGRIDEAEIGARAVLERARAIDYRPIEAAALARLGSALENAARAEEAAPVLLAAAVAAEAARDDQLLADVRILLTMVEGDRLGKRDRGHLWAELARASLERIGGDPLREAQLENNLALVLEGEARPEEVLVHQRRALELARGHATLGELRLAGYHNNLAGTLAELGRHDEALAHAEDARRIWEEALGPDHARTAIAYGMIGLVHDYAGRLDDALQWYEKSHAILERRLGADNTRAIEILSNIAIVSVRKGDHDRALAAFRRVLDAQTAKFGSDSPLVAQAEQNLGQALREAGQADEARIHHQRALALREKLLGPEDPEVAKSLHGLAAALADLDRHAEAIALRERALAIDERTYGREHHELALELANLAHEYVLTGRVERGREPAERAARLAIHPSHSPDTRAFCRAVLALTLAPLPEQRERARGLVEQAEAELGELPATREREVVAAARAAVEGR